MTEPGSGSSRSRSSDPNDAMPDGEHLGPVRVRRPASFRWPTPRRSARSTGRRSAIGSSATSSSRAARPISPLSVIDAAGNVVDPTTLDNCFGDNVFGSSAPAAIEDLFPCDGEASGGDWTVASLDVGEWITAYTEGRPRGRLSHRADPGSAVARRHVEPCLGARRPCGRPPAGDRPRIDRRSRWTVNVTPGGVEWGGVE